MRARGNKQTLAAALLLGATSALSFALAGCGEDGQGIHEAGKCPAQPLYHYEFSDGGGKWVARHAAQVPPVKGTNTPLTKDEQAELDEAMGTAAASIPGRPNFGGPRCLTPSGNAKTLDAGS